MTGAAGAGRDLRRELKVEKRHWEFFELVLMREE